MKSPPYHSHTSSWIASVFLFPTLTDTVRLKMHMGMLLPISTHIDPDRGYLRSGTVHRPKDQVLRNIAVLERRFPLLWVFQYPVPSGDLLTSLYSPYCLRYSGFHFRSEVFSPLCSWKLCKRYIVSPGEFLACKRQPQFTYHRYRRTRTYPRFLAGSP